MRSFRVNSFSEMLIAGGRSSNTTFLHKLVTAWLTAVVWIAWSVVFLSFAIISGSTALRCLVNRGSFIILLGGSLVVMEKLTLSGSRHLAKYYADSSSECSFTFSRFASACRWSTMAFCDIRWKSSEPHFACIGYFYSWCRVGLCSKLVQHNLWSISQPPCKSLARFLSVVPRMYQPKPWGYYFCRILSLLHGCYAYWMIVRCPYEHLKSLGTVPEVAVSPRWVFSGGF